MYNGLGICKEQQLDMPLNSNGDQERGKEPGYGFRKTRPLKILATVTVTVTVLILGLISTAAALAVRTAKPCLDCANVPSCPDGWVGYQRQCYFFSEDERNWTASQSYCSSHSASLAGIDSGLEMTFLLRYKGSVYHWIGLRKEPSQSWKWPNGTEFHNRFEVRGGGNCAYLNDIGVSSSNCETEKNWICARPDRCGKRKENSLEGTEKQ
ncbi:C-type lectin domain family 2 member D-like [Gopherus flavomarginatus]|uniref:C-type lectin domain family 2 member D-like n=1 Tax=Gopherus flavomarginatus TaxID=286002 RepID=UPI0021CC3670|nr:C-type lectin domain family 2 member D-like [Gopherus flavomarginatus]